MSFRASATSRWAAVFAERMAEHLAAVKTGLADPDPWSGFASYVRTVAAMQSRDLGIVDLVIMDVSSAPDIERLRSQAFDGLVHLVERARSAGVRPAASVRTCPALLFA